MPLRYNLPMRILINAVSARAGGGVAYLLKLLELLPAAAPEMQFLAAVPEIDFLKDLQEQKNLEIVRVKQASGNLLSRYYWENTGLIELCRSWNADALFCVANVVPLVDPGIEVVLMVQNVAPLTPRALKMLWRFEPAAKALQMLALKWLSLFSISRAGRIISLSHATAKLIERIKPGAASEVLYHGISAEFNPQVPRPEAAGTDPYFLYVSNLYVYKGLEYIVEALAADPDLPRVLIAGRPYDAAYVNHVRNLAEKAGVSARLQFLDGIPRMQLPGWYAHAVAMVYTSWCENCPNILLESMACGCPVVAMQIGPMPEICGDTAFYARPFSGKSLAQAMSQAVAAQSSLQVRQNAIRRAGQFTWSQAMQRHRDIFSQLK